MANFLEKRMGQQLVEVPVLNFIHAGYDAICSKANPVQVVKVTRDVDVKFTRIDVKQINIDVHNHKTGQHEMVVYRQRQGDVAEIFVVNDIHKARAIDYYWIAVYLAKAVGGLFSRVTITGEPIPVAPGGNGYSAIAADEVTIHNRNNASLKTMAQ